MFNNFRDAAAIKGKAIDQQAGNSVGKFDRLAGRFTVGFRFTSLVVGGLVRSGKHQEIDQSAGISLQ